MTAPGALFYYGWYNYGTYRDVWEWLPGSAASDLNSNSIARIRSQAPGTFVAGAMRRGLTAGVGSRPNRLPQAEEAVIGYMRALHSAQKQFREGVVVDQDLDGLGEFGWLGELSGAEVGRNKSRDRQSASPFVSKALGDKYSDGTATRSGYFFVVYLMVESGKWVRELAVLDGMIRPEDANAQGSRWRAYAWPTRFGGGRRAFFIDESGVLFSTAAADANCVGGGVVPAADLRESGQVSRWRRVRGGR